MNYKWLFLILFTLTHIYQLVLNLVQARSANNPTPANVADVYDAAEMLPWIRTFIGRISELKCSSAYVEQRFREDLRRMNEMYGGESDAVQ